MPVLIFNIVFHAALDRFNRVEVRAEGWPFYHGHSSFTEVLVNTICGMGAGVVLHEDKLRLLLLLTHRDPAIDERDRMGAICLLHDCALFLLPEEAGTLLMARDAREAAPEYPTTLPLVFFDDAIGVPNLVAFVSDVLLAMGASSYPCLVSPKDLRPLLGSPILVIFSPLEACLAVLLSDGWLSMSDVAFIA